MNPNPDTKQVGTPDEQVAHSIAENLLRDGLVDESQIDKIISGLSAGSIRSSDWTLIVESVLEMEGLDDKGTN